MTRILGIDPGLNVCGYGVLEVAGPTPRLVEAGVIRTRRRHTLQQRLVELHTGMQEILAAHTPQRMALEQLFSHYDRPRTAILMGHARGVICLCAGLAGIDIEHYEPTRVKKLLTGNGRAPKHQMQQAVRLQLNLPAPPEPADVADALALALCDFHISRLPTEATL